MQTTNINIRTNANLKKKVNKLYSHNMLDSIKEVELMEKNQKKYKVYKNIDDFMGKMLKKNKVVF